ncbi:MAG TPA: hypothetical protein VJV04_02205, partial [Nitrospiraceae bacterium]|nr:hypothetical protein [Nitrospiraceae bacterium]
MPDDIKQRIEKQLTALKQERIYWQTDDIHSWGELSEATKLRVLEAEFDWTGINDKQKEDVLSAEIDFKQITRDQLNFVYEEIASDEIDERPARRLFDEANFANAVANADRSSFEAQ